MVCTWPSSLDTSLLLILDVSSQLFCIKEKYGTNKLFADDTTPVSHAEVVGAAPPCRAVS